ncbi:hypothetical protein RSOLAG1IB_10450 [Rhizoctonia solani AG-1 IB]|uniref:Uncharacterized protein n=1 Tax=Thanatephorus cucumeris (strain AG1-IB / isolate 7/3/14) TaxID=1108050 RepID=A0A0B7FZX7_THACB|nr:hypothetical protein RSOLAG1IB_10450 [Rhizoctonia solani AG-1 IB]
MSKADSKDTEPKRNNVTRKAQSRSINTLPYEILFDIFIDYVYRPSDTRVMDVMVHRTMYIYQRVHTLLAVCTTWRRTATACTDLWTVVPFIDGDNGLRYPLAAPLSLERAGRKGLHLVIPT